MCSRVFIKLSIYTQFYENNHIYFYTTTYKQSHMTKLNLSFFLSILLSCCSHWSAAQSGYITAIVGNGTSGFSGDGGPATAATMGQALGVAVDAAGNIYVPDNDNNALRKVSPAGIITTIAGGGSSTADGIPATDAAIVLGFTAIDAYGYIYIRDADRVRKINPLTGIITTVAGTTTGGFSGDGGPATAAELNAPQSICFDLAGNMYIADDNNERIRKVNGAGIISTYVGIGTSGFSGDGGPATAAELYYPSGVCIDAVGNLFIAENYNYRIRKVSPSGIISTYAGGGSGGDGGPATNASLNEPSQVCLDNSGNLYIADFHNGRVRMVSPSGIITTFAGGGASGVNSGVPATDASLTDVWAICIDNYSNIYIADRSHNQICRVGLGVPAATAASFSIYTTNLCAGPQLMITTTGYSASYNQVTSFGDGSSDTTAISAGTTGGVSLFNHNYSTPGLYTLKTVLRNGALPIDSVIYAYQFRMCNVLHANLYIDNNSNAIYDSASDAACYYPVKIEIDSNGIAIDTIAGTSGFYYTAYGTSGDIYAMKIIMLTPGLSPSSPFSGILYDTLSATSNPPDKYFGLVCSSVPGSNLAVHTANRCGSHHYGGELLVDNLYCSPTGSSTLTLSISPKYTYQSASPTPTSVSGNTLTWNLSGVSSASAPMHISISGESPGTTYLPGDTVHSEAIIGPFIGDVDTTDNVANPVDTVKSGYDPNFIDVSPKGNVLAGTRLEYTIGFENTGNDTAFNIHVLDTLSDDLDPSTMEMVTASSAMNIYRYTALGHTIFKFDFPHINLLDSSYHNQCDGMLIYTIKSKPGTPDCRLIPNRAGIYFDENPVVMTNEIRNVNGNCFPANINEIGMNTNVALYPNPAYDQLTINADQKVFSQIKITNSIGATLLSKQTNLNQTQMDIQSLPAGLYYVVLKGNSGTVLKKFIKL